MRFAGGPPPLPDPKLKIEDTTLNTNKYTKLTVNLKSSRNSALIPHLVCCSNFGFVESQIPVAPEFRFPPEGAPEFRLSPEGSAFRRNSGCRRNSGTDRQGVGPTFRSPEGRTSSQYPEPCSLGRPFVERSRSADTFLTSALNVQCAVRTIR